jgi:hypothetical protein
VNICAVAGTASAETSIAASKSATDRRTPRLPPSVPLPPVVIPHAFHRKRGKFKPPAHQDVIRGTGRSPYVLEPGSRSSHNPGLARPLTAA